MKKLAQIAALGLVLIASPMLAQDEGGSDGAAENIVVTGQRRSSSMSSIATVGVADINRRPVIGLRRQADSALRRIEITSDSLDEDVRRKEVETMLLSALDRAKGAGLSLVIGEFVVVEVTRENWKDLFPALVGKSGAQEDEDEDDDDDDDNGRAKSRFEDDGRTATLRLMVKTKLTGSIADAERRIGSFAKAVPASGRSEIHQKGDLALTIINPEQYRDEIYRRVAVGSKHASSFYGPEYGVEIVGLDREIAWEQVSNTEVFLYIPYSFTVAK